MDQRELGISVSANIEDVMEKISELVNTITSIVDKIVNLDVNISDEEVKGLKTELENLSDMVIAPELSGENDTLSSLLDSIESEVTLLDSQSIQIDLSAQDSASDIMAAVQALNESLDGAISTITIEAEGDALEVAESVKAAVEELDGLSATVSIQSEENITDDLESTSSAMDDVITGATGVAGGIGMMKLGMDGLNFDKYIEQAITYGHATEADKAAIEDLVRSLSSGKYQVNDIAKAYDYLTQATQSTEEASAELPGMMAYIKTKGSDLENGIYRLTTLFGLYGIDAQESADASAYLAEMLTKTKLSGDQFLDLMSKFSVDLSSLGFTIQDTGALIAAMDISDIPLEQINRLRGGFKSFIADFKEGSARLPEMEAGIQALGLTARDASGNLKPAGEMLKEILARLGEMPNTTEKTQDAIAIFGTQTGTIMGGIKVNYQDLETQVNTSSQSIAKDIREINKAHREAPGVVENWSQVVASSWGWLTSQIMQWGGVIIQGISGMMVAGAALKYLLPESALTTIAGWGSRFIGFLSPIGTFITQTLIPTITGGLSNLVSAFTGSGVAEAAASETIFVGDSFAAMSGEIAASEATVTTASSMSIASITGLAAAAIGGGIAAGHMANLMDEAFASVSLGQNVFMDLEGALWNFLNVLGGPIISTFKALATAIYDLIWGGKSLGEVLPEYFNNAFLGSQQAAQRMFNYLGSVMGQIKTIIGQWGSNLYNWVKNAWNWFIQGIYSVFPTIQAALQNVYNIVMSGIDWLLNLPGTLYNMGANAINGLIQGIQDTIPGLNTALGWIRDYFPFSDAKTGPLSDISTWGTSFGETLSNSFEGGMDDFADETANSLQNSLVSIKDTVELSSQDVGSGIVEGISLGIDGTQDTLKEALDETQYCIVNQNTLMAGMGDDYKNTGKGLVDELSEGIDQGVTPGLEGSVDGVGDTVQYPVPNPEATKENWKQLGYGLAGSLAAGITAGKPLVDAALEGIGAGVEGHSPPKEGPLRFLDEWGENLGKLLIDSFSLGIINSIPVLQDTLSQINPSINATISDFALPQHTMEVISSQTTTGAPVIQFNGDIIVKVDGNVNQNQAKEVGKIAGRAAGEELADTMKNRMRVLGFKL